MRVYRKERISDLILEELNKIIAHELEFEGALVTLTDVNVAEDLKRAVVKFSVLPPSKESRVLDVLNKFHGRLQHLLWKKINIRPMPLLIFEIDHGLEQAAEVERLMIDKNS